jgi:hypothetical protein
LIRHIFAAIIAQRERSIFLNAEHTKENPMAHKTSLIPARAVTHGPNHHSFGYYDKSPWNACERYMLGLETKFHKRPPTPQDVAVIGLIDTHNDYAWKPVAETTAWNWQQGTMLQWLGSSPNDTIIYNVREKDAYASVILNIETGEKRTLPLPIYGVSPDGTKAVSPNFARIHNHRPGYGYIGFEDKNKGTPAPDDDGIHCMDIESGEHKLVISIAQILDIQHDASMDGAFHWFNHLQFNTDGTRFVFLHRWKDAGQTWHHRLFAASPAGSDICYLSGDELVSHFDWRDASHVLAWTRKEGGDRFYLLRDMSEEFSVVGEGVLMRDGHCSYSPDRRFILCDTYPYADNMRILFLLRVADSNRVDLGRFLSPPEITGEIRCDLHPRWSRDGRKVCFDSVHEGTRQMYAMDVSDVVSD